MTLGNLRNKAVPIALSLAAIFSASGLTASSQCENKVANAPRAKVKPAQAIFQDDVVFTPVVDQKIPFAVKNLKENVDVNEEKTTFKVEVSGLYSLDAFLLVNVPAVGNSVAGYITINHKKFLNFYSRETSATSTILELHFNDRYVYLKKGDKVSVVLTELTQGTTVGARGFVMIAFNNSKTSCH